jgi:NADH dehydrogenase FAD-containing subunit
VTKEVCDVNSYKNRHLGRRFSGDITALQLERLFRRPSDIEITLLDNENFFTFTPLLPESPAVVES